MGLFMTGKSCLAYLTLCKKATCLVDEEKVVHVDYLDFSKVFDFVSSSILQ